LSFKVGDTYRGCLILEFTKKKARPYIKIQCKCGNIMEKRKDIFIKCPEFSITCGCESPITKKGVGKYNYESFIGKTYREVEIISLFEKIINGRTVKYFNVKCSCGTEYSHQCTDLLRRKNEYVPVNCGCQIDNRDIFRKYGITTYKQVYSNYSRLIDETRNLTPLPYEDWLKIVENPCNYCGEFQYKNPYYVKNDPFNRSKNKTTKVYKKITPDEVVERYTVKCCGIDRVDNSLGYTLENSVPCCTRCNIAKGTLTLEDFKEHVKKMYKHLFGIIDDTQIN
jgi:hypothetical protein